MIRRLLMAKSGEIGVGILRMSRASVIETVTVYLKPDRRSLVVRLVDRSARIAEAAAQSRLNGSALVDAPLFTDSDAEHPRYSSLSENAQSVRFQPRAFDQRVADSSVQ